MKKKIACAVFAGMLLVFGLTGCAKTTNVPVDSGLPGSATVEQPSREALKDIDLQAKGILLTGYQQDLLLSPDSKVAAFSGYRYDTEKSVVETKMVLADLVSGDVRTFDNVTRVLGWLPDSSGILYQYEGALRMLDLKTGNFKEIAPDSWYGSISPDGKQVAYAQRGKGLFMYDLATSRCKQLTKQPYEWYPVWYPDGKSLFYFTDLGKPLGDGAGTLEGMAKISVDSGQMERIGKDEGKFRRAEWIVPGKSLHIVKGWDDGFYHGILDLEQNKYTDLGENLMDSTYFVSVDTNKGQLIQSAKGKVSIYDSHGNKVASYSLPETNLQNFHYAVSPKGDKLAFVHGDYGRFLDSKIKGNKVKISDSNGQNVKELTSEYTYNDAIVWDKTGKTVISLQMDLEKITAIRALPVQ